MANIMEGLDEIVEAINEKKCIPFLGAGVSVLAGCSDWNSILTELQSLKELQEFLSKNPGLLTSSLNRQTKIRLLESQLKKIGKEDRFDNVMRRILHCDSKLTSGGKYPILIKAIEKVFLYSKILLTTNIDNCLEATDSFHPNKGYSAYYTVKNFKIIRLSEGGVYYLHGNRDQRKESVLSDEAYYSRYSDVAYENFLCYIFRHYTVLFIGKDLNSDEQLMKIVEQMKERTHFALTKKGAYSLKEKTSFKLKYNLKIIEYPEHKLLPDLFQGWVDKNFPETELQEPPKSKLYEPEKEGVKNV